MFDFFVKSKKKKKKTADKDGCERQETSSSTNSLTECPLENTAETNLFEIPMKVKHRLHQISPAPAERNIGKRSFQKNWLRDYI